MMVEKLLKIECKYLYLCYVLNVSSVNARMDLTVDGTSTTLAISLIRKIEANFFADIFRIELPIGLPPHRNEEHWIDLIIGANLVARPPYCMSFKEENKVKKVVDAYLSKGLICPSYPLLPCLFYLLRTRKDPLGFV